MESTDAFKPNHEDEHYNAAKDYFNRAAAACDTGDAVLGMYLYLAAFEESANAAQFPHEEMLSGLKRAWALACTFKERALAEYIFEKMEPYLNADETIACADELQNLAFDKLEELGLSRSDLEDMAEAISQEFAGLDSPVISLGSIVEHPQVRTVNDEASSSSSEPKAIARIGALVHAGNKQENTNTPQVVDEKEQQKNEKNDTPSDEKKVNLASVLQDHEASGITFIPEEEVLTYDKLAGYGSTITTMRDLGIGMQNDADFIELVGMLNARHGLTSMPALDTLLFRAPAREDANRFMEATLGELKRPCVRMRMEENLQGLPLLCVSAHADSPAKLRTLKDAFDNGGVLVLEDVDTWTSPLADLNEEPQNFLMMQLSRGAREAIGMIEAAVENPDVFVIATASLKTDIDEFFLSILEPISVVEIDYPTPEERVEIWMDLAHEHPSLRGVNRTDLVRLSANMPRFDIYMAAREAVEEAYKLGLMSRRYQPVTRDNLFDKLAAYQPLESREYKELEEAVIRDFGRSLDALEDSLLGNYDK